MLRSILHSVPIVFCMAMSAFADGISQPAGNVILTVSGQVQNTNVDGTAQLDLDMFESLEMQTIETSTIWTEGVQTFSGVPLATLMAELGITGNTLRATAVNDYTIELPLADAVKNGPIIAYRLNGKIMSLRDKGPLWIVYPYDDKAEYRTEVIYSRSIWQLDRIEAVN